jgi:hypothetical protein
MIFALSPSVIATLGSRGIRSLMLGATVAGVVAFLHAGTSPNSDYAFVAVVLGLAYALVVGSVGFMFALSSGFSASDRDLRMTWLLVVLPCLVSSMAAVLYAVTAVIAAHATHVQLVAAQTVRMTGILLSGLLLLVPLRGRSWRSLHSVLVPLALVWLCVWLFGGLR